MGLGLRLDLGFRVKARIRVRVMGLELGIWLGLRCIYINRGVHTHHSHRVGRRVWGRVKKVRIRACVQVIAWVRVRV